MRRIVLAIAVCAALCAAATPALEKVVFVGGHPDDFAANKRLNGDFRGRNMRVPVKYAEAYATYPGAAQGARCIFSELPNPNGGTQTRR